MQQNENENDKNKIYSQTIVQGRLTKSEWNNMEIPVSPDELTVIKLIRDSYHNVQLKMNHNSSMIGILKTSSSPEMHAHLYQKHFEQLVHEMVKTFQMVPAFSCDADTISKQGDGSSKKGSKNKPTELKKVDAIRIKNNESALSGHSKNIFEHTILKICKLLLTKKAKWNILQQQDEKDEKNEKDKSQDSESESES